MKKIVIFINATDKQVYTVYSTDISIFFTAHRGLWFNYFICTVETVRSKFYKSVKK